jgi:predicted RNase H-like nuclease (RuvC/YqgF family)
MPAGLLGLVLPSLVGAAGGLLGAGYSSNVNAGEAKKAREYELEQKRLEKLEREKMVEKERAEREKDRMEQMRKTNLQALMGKGSADNPFWNIVQAARSR